MPWSRRSAAVAAMMIACTVTASAAPQRVDDDDPSITLPFSFLPDGSPKLGGPRTTEQGPGTPGVTAPLVPPAAKAVPPAPRSHADMLEDLFHRLAAAADSGEATGLASRIQRLWLDSGSDTADLLMSRAAVAAVKGDSKLALQLLDKIVVLTPAWAEAWNKRANLRYMDNDDDGAMGDLGHVLSLEPRHFGALTGMAVIMGRNGFKKDALALLRKAASVYPHNDDLSQMIEKLSLDVEGQPT